MLGTNVYHFLFYFVVVFFCLSDSIKIRCVEIFKEQAHIYKISAHLDISMNEETIFVLYVLMCYFSDVELTGCNL